ncbi:MAG: class I tRNA ligase family protein [Candidatus Paceibacterota bacterium]|nr:MAG: class I tRNA ligase family protein [Candidatus Paceibacterota bacterium]
MTETFHTREERTRRFWKDHHIFQKSIDRRAGAEPFVFFEGPPTANGLPHIGHFLTRIFKDLYGRYKTMRGFRVLRKAGWDTHGLPVELEVEKELGFKGKKDIEAYGIAAFNTKAKASVWKYRDLWEKMTERMGFWLDMRDPYITYGAHYVESLWNVIGQIWDKQLLYQAHRVIPFCTRCGTGLSSHEVAQGYETVTDTSVYALFPLRGESAFPKGTAIVAWTTTPWTLPGNVALAVGENITYALVRREEGFHIVARDLVEKIYGADAVIERECSGKELVGLSYEPLFSVPALQSDASYKVYAADFVTTGDGTGIVHTAVMYGEDDYALGTRVGLPKVHTVDAAGFFTGVGELLDGRYAKDPKTEALILETLAAQGRVVRTEPYEHEYPHCWRCHKPLLYYAKESWFIRMSAVNKELLANNETINWYPEHIKDGRFGQWLREGKDWAFSRERYWGTPLPVWVCGKPECRHMRVISSYADLDGLRTTKPTRLVLARHGLTTRGKDGNLIISSLLEHDTYDLTEEGREQIRKGAELLKASGGVDAIIASPFRRTQQTAAIFSEALGIPVATDERLGELNHGLVCEGKTHAVCQVPEVANTMDAPFGDGESWRDVTRRMVSVARELNVQYAGKRVLIVSHGDPLWLLESALRGLSDAEILAARNTQYIEQGSVHELTFPNWPFNDEGQLDPHRPYIDEIVIRCEKCDGDMRRVPEVIDVWFDSGCMPYAQWHWPFEHAERLDPKSPERQFPADFIVEAVDQTRGWFYTMLAVGTLLGRGAPYKNVIVLGHTLDAKGRKMSKSLGNTIKAEELMDAAGVDATRWKLYSMNAPWEPKSIDPKEFIATLKGFFGTLENCVCFFELYVHEKNAPLHVSTHALDRWLVSRLALVINTVTERLDAYDPTPAARALESFIVEDLSKWWLRRSRKREEALPLLRETLLTCAKLLAPFTPYTAEDIASRMGFHERDGEESIHLAAWPTVDASQRDEALEEEMRLAQEVVTRGLALRKEHNIRVRQPLARMFVAQPKAFSADIAAIICDELNIKELAYGAPADALDMALTPELRAEGLARECMRIIQDMRKDAGYRVQDKVYCQWYTEHAELSAALIAWTDAMTEDAVLSAFVKKKDADATLDQERTVELAPGMSVWIGVRA